jgi:transcriptional regulator with XRE-family HTH domain
MTKGRATLHSHPIDLPSNAPRDAALIEFGLRLQRALIEKGWTQSELARRATQFMADGKNVTRGQISNYVTGVVMPAPPRLYAIAKALGKEPGHLVPVRGVTGKAAKATTFDLRDAGGGTVWIRVNQQVDFAQALKIMEILAGSMIAGGGSLA